MNNFLRSQSSDTQMRLHYRLGLVTTEREREAIFAIRTLVFVDEQAVPPEEEVDTYDTDAIHFLAAYSDNAASHLSSLESSIQSKNGKSENIVGTARLVGKGNGVGKIGRVAILLPYRGLGIGAMLMRYIEETARNCGFTTLVLEAQCYAIPFYEKLGYVAEGEVFLDANIEHRHMHKTL